MVTEPHEDEIDKLLAKGRQQGYVTPQDLLEVFPKPEDDVEAVDEAYDR